MVVDIALTRSARYTTSMREHLETDLHPLLTRLSIEGGEMFIHEAAADQVFEWDDLKAAQSRGLISIFDPPGYGTGMHIALTDAGNAALRGEPYKPKGLVERIKGFLFGA